MQLGRTLLDISTQGIGCMSMSEFYGAPLANEHAIELLKVAFNEGVNFFDTADVYGYGRNEILVGQAVSHLMACGIQRESICVATKYGILRDEHDTTKRGIDNSYSYTLAACHASLDRLGEDVGFIDLYYVHRIANQGEELDQAMKAMALLLSEGKIKAVGLSEASVEHIQCANQALLKYTDGQHAIAAVQSEYSLVSRVVERNGVLALCQQLGITFVAYSPLSRALLTGEVETADGFAADDFRRSLPRFSPENISHNLITVRTVKQMAHDIGCQPSQLALAWLIQKGVVPIPGTTKMKNLITNITAMTVSLSDQQMLQLDQLEEAKGYRYSAAAMKAYGFDDEM